MQRPTPLRRRLPSENDEEANLAATAAADAEAKAAMEAATVANTATVADADAPRHSAAARHRKPKATHRRPLLKNKISSWCPCSYVGARAVV